MTCNHRESEIASLHGMDAIGAGRVKCRVCGEVWISNGLGWVLSIEETRARNPDLQHTFTKNDGMTCENCGLYAGNALRQCVNPNKDVVFRNYLFAINHLSQSQALLEAALKQVEEWENQLVSRECPLCRGKDIPCGLCKGKRMVGRL